MKPIVKPTGNKGNLPLVVCIILLTFMITSCAPTSWIVSQNAYRNGNIQKSVEYAAKSLREKPGYEEAIDFLVKMLPQTYDQKYELAKREEMNKNWDAVYKLYSEIQAISDIASQIPMQTHPRTKQRISFSTKNVHDEIKIARDNAAEMFYERGVQLEDAGKNKESARAYSQVLEYVSGYKDATERYERMRQSALQRVAIMPFENTSGKQQYGQIGEFISEYIVDNIYSTPANREFMDLISRERLGQLLNEQRLGGSDIINPATAAEKGKVLGLHAFVFGKVTSISESRPPETSESIRESTVIKSKGKPDRTVSAVTTIINRKVSVTITCSYEIVDVNTGQILDHGLREIKEEVEIQFCKLSGDERAVSFSTRRKCRDNESYPPPATELANRAAKKASTTLSSLIVANFK